MNQDQQPRDWWKDNRLAWALAGFTFGLVIIATRGYWWGWFRTGIQAKSSWDWLELLIIPAVLALGGYLFSHAERKSDHEIATNRTQEELLQSYFDRMTDLLLKEGLLDSESEQDSPVKDVARARTLAVLRQLDGVRKGMLLRFLYEAKLIGRWYMTYNRNEELDWDFGPEDICLGTLVSLRGADLSLANLQGIHLEIADLRGTTLIRSNLKGARLRMADLMDANLTGAKGITVKQISMARTLYRAKLDRRILKKLRKDYPQLLQKPPWVYDPDHERLS